MKHCPLFPHLRAIENFPSQQSLLLQSFLISSHLHEKGFLPNPQGHEIIPSNSSIGQTLCSWRVPSLTSGWHPAHVQLTTASSPFLLAWCYHTHFCQQTVSSRLPNFKRAISWLASLSLSFHIPVWRLTPLRLGDTWDSIVCITLTSVHSCSKQKAILVCKYGLPFLFQPGTPLNSTWKCLRKLKTLKTFQSDWNKSSD